MSARQAAELDHAFARAGWRAEDVKKLSKGSILRDFLDVLHGKKQIQTADLSICLNDSPFVPKGYTLERHTGEGVYRWGPDNFITKVFDHQKVGKGLSGQETLRLLSIFYVANANVLDFLLARPYLIPDHLKGRRLYFWGTIYRNNRSQCHCVRYLECLAHDSGSWADGFSCINTEHWGESDYAICLAWVHKLRRSFNSPEPGSGALFKWRVLCKA